MKAKLPEVAETFVEIVVVGIISIFGLLWMLAVGTFWFVLPILGILVLWNLSWYVWGV